MSVELLVNVIVPVAVYLVAGKRAEPSLTAMKTWLLANNATVMTVLFLVLGCSNGKNSEGARNIFDPVSRFPTFASANCEDAPVLSGENTQKL